MNFLDRATANYVSVLSRYVKFEGRARRYEFWMFTVVNAVVSIALFECDKLAHFKTFQGVGPIAGFYALAILCPSIGLRMRRLRDAGFAPWWLLLTFVPFVGELMMLPFYLLPSLPEHKSS